MVSVYAAEKGFQKAKFNARKDAKEVLEVLDTEGHHFSKRDRKVLLRCFTQYFIARNGANVEECLFKFTHTINALSKEYRRAVKENYYEHEFGIVVYPPEKA